MGYEITYPASHDLSDADIVRTLNEQNPDKKFSIQNGTIIEEHREQPSFREMLENSPWHRARLGAAERAVAVSEADSAATYIERVTNDAL